MLPVTNLINNSKDGHFAFHIGLSLDGQDIFWLYRGVNYFLGSFGESKIGFEERLILRGD